MQLTVKHVARIFNMPEAAVYRLIKKGQLPVYRINDQYRFNRSELVEWATLNKVNMAPSAFLEPEAEALPATRLTDALQAGGIFYHLPGPMSNATLFFTCCSRGSNWPPPAWATASRSPIRAARSCCMFTRPW